MPLRIGFPRALFYYSHFPFWKAFFNSLGFEFIISPTTTKKILDDGAREAVADACIPIKLYHGHVLALRNNVDAIFIPRLVKINRHSTFCPKFLGLPDMVRASLDQLPPIIDFQIDTCSRFWGWWSTCKGLSEILSCSRRKTWSAYKEAIHYQKLYENLLLKGYFPQQAMAMIEGKNVKIQTKRENALNLAVLGYPYQVHDRHISFDIIGKLARVP